MKLYAFDIETAKVADNDRNAPLDITVAAAVFPGWLFKSGAEQVRMWHDANFKPKIELETAIDILARFAAAHTQGNWTAVAWNGLSFDLRMIAHAANSVRSASHIALDSMWDPMFQFLCQRGFPISLKACAECMLDGRTKIEDGADAPALWLAGEHQRVIDYVVDDCRITAELARAILEQGKFRWRTKRGDVREEPLAFGEALTPRECIERLEPPDQSWMEKPLSIARAFSWVEGVEGQLREKWGGEQNNA